MELMSERVRLMFPMLPRRNPMFVSLLCIWFSNYRLLSTPAASELNRESPSPPRPKNLIGIVSFR